MTQDTFNVPTNFTFTGNFKIKAASQEEANEIAKKHCGMNMGEVHTSYGNEVDWEFDTTPIKNQPGFTEENFDEIFKPVKNHIDDNAAHDGYMFETYKDELNHVIENANKKPNHVWTVTELDDGNMMFCTGYHLVNRQGYIITENPWVTGDEDVFIDLSNDDQQVIVIETPSEEDPLNCNILSNKPESQHPLVLHRYGSTSDEHEYERLEIIQDDGIASYDIAYKAK